MLSRGETPKSLNWALIEASSDEPSPSVNDEARLILSDMPAGLFALALEQTGIKQRRAKMPSEGYSVIGWYQSSSTAPDDLSHARRAIEGDRWHC